MIIILLATNLTNKMEFNQSLCIMTVIMKIMNKKVIMTSLSAFIPFFSHISMVIGVLFLFPTLHSGCPMAALITLFMVNQA